MKRKISLAMVVVLLLVLLVALGAAATNAQSTRERFGWAIMDKLTVREGGATFNSNVTMNDDLSLGGDLDVDDLTVDGYIQGDGIYVANTSGDTLITGTLGVSGTVTYGSYAAAWSDPITITGVLTNVRVLYYQVP